MKPVIAVDLDSTLIETIRIKRALFSLARRYGAGKEETASAYYRARNRGFSPDRFSRFLFGSSEQHSKFNEGVAALFSRPKRYNYPGAETFLKKLSGRYRLVLLTYGDDRFQRLKLDNSGLSNYFFQVSVVRQYSKEAALRRLHLRCGRLAVIDDSMACVATALKIGTAAVIVRSGPKNQDYYERLLTKILSII